MIQSWKGFPAPLVVDDWHFLVVTFSWQWIWRGKPLTFGLHAHQTSIYKISLFGNIWIHSCEKHWNSRSKNCYYSREDQHDTTKLWENEPVRILQHNIWPSFLTAILNLLLITINLFLQLMFLYFFVFLQFSFQFFHLTLHFSFSPCEMRP